MRLGSDLNEHKKTHKMRWLSNIYENALLNDRTQLQIFVASKHCDRGSSPKC